MYTTAAVEDTSRGGSSSFLASLPLKLANGAIAGITGTLCIYPLDMIKTRLQNQRPDPKTGQLPFRNGLDCLRKLIRVDGIRGVYRGLVPNLVGITPEKAIKLAVNDAVREFLAKRRGVGVDGIGVVEGMLAGASAGVCQVIATNPMEIVKIRMQVQAGGTLPPGVKRKTAMQVVRELGVKGLYRGTPATLLRDVPFSFIFFPLHAKLKYTFSPFGKNDRPPFHAVFLGGIVAGAIAGAAVTPADVIKTRLQAAEKVGGGGVSVGIGHTAREIVHKEGARALFKGAGWRAAIISPLFAIALLTYEVQQRFFGKEKR